VKGDVDGGNRRLQNPPAFEVLAAIDSCQIRPICIGSRPMRKLAIVLDRAGHGLLATAQAALAPAEDALVGLDLDEHLVARSDPHRIGLDRGDS
jgi:hypothetical protein